MNSGSFGIRTTIRKEHGSEPHIVNGYFYLHPQDSSYAIQLNTALLSRLNAEIAIAARLGREIGGLLIGSFPKAAEITIRIDDFVLVDRRDGDEARYNLKPEQRARLSTTRHELIQKQNQVVGFFRSHLRREGLALSADDRKLLTTEFGKAIYTALLIRARRPHSAVFISPDADGALPAGPPRKGWKFDAEAVGLPDARPLSPQPAERELPSQLHAESLSERAAPAPIRRRAFWIISIACLVALGLALTVRAPFTANVFGWRRSSLDLRIVPQGNTLKVEWNRRQPDLSSAGGAVLSIEENGSARQLRLSPIELHAGKVSYRPQSKHVVVRMTLQLPDAAELVQTAAWNGQP